MLWNAKNGSVRIQNTQMSYVSFGHGSRILIILPGLSDGLASVKGKAFLLAPPYRRYFDSYTIYMFSRRDDLPAGHSIRDMAADQAEALRVLGIEKASFLGVSQGGLVAQWLAIDHPALVEQLILAVTAPRVNEMLQDNIEQWIGFAEAGKHRELMIDTAEKSYSPDTLKKYRKLYPLIGFVGRPKSYDRFLANARAILSFDVYDLLDQITCPTLIIGGEKDRIVGVQGSYELKEQITGSKLVIYPEFGHAAYEEAKDFNQKVFDFLAKERPVAKAAPPNPGLCVIGFLPAWIREEEMNAVVCEKEYQELSIRCQEGSRESMLRFAAWYKSLSTDEKDVYIAASHFWELRYHYVQNPEEAQKFLDRWLSDHPDKEYRVLVNPSLTGNYRGEILRFAGIPGWEGYTQYISGGRDKLLIVDEVVYQSRTDNDSDYRRYICDQNLKQVPGSKTFLLFDNEFDEEQKKEYEAELERAKKMVR